MLGVGGSPVRWVGVGSSTEAPSARCFAFGFIHLVSFNLFCTPKTQRRDIGINIIHLARLGNTPSLVFGGVLV